MDLHKITPADDYNWWLKRLDTQQNESTNQNSLKVRKVHPVPSNGMNELAIK